MTKLREKLTAKSRRKQVLKEEEKSSKVHIGGHLGQKECRPRSREIRNRALTSKNIEDK